MIEHTGTVPSNGQKPYPAETPTLIGQTVSHYHILSRLGAGGMGEIYLAKDTKLDRLVALKVLPAEVARDTERIRRFEQEAKAASALNHPNILTIYDVGQSGDLHFIVSEYIKGENLHERLEREPLSLDETLDIAVKVAAALVAAHKAGIMHRDINARNIMLGEDGLVKVVDFGLAKLTGKRMPQIGSEDPTLIARTAPGIVMGTAAYMSPEQLEEKDVDERTDVWSLGICLYEMLSGRPPFLRETFGCTIASILRDDLAPLGDNVPEELNRIVRTALQKDRDERYQTIKDFWFDLNTLKHELETTREVRRPPRPPQKTEPAGGKLSRYNRDLIITGLAVLLLTVAGISLLKHWQREARRHEAIGREYLKQRTGDNLNKAKEHFESAIYYDPSYPQPYAGLADAYVLMEEYLGIPTRETIPKAEQYAKKALKLDDSLAETHASLGFILTKLWKWQEAEKEFQRAIALNPKYPKAYQWYSLYLRIVGRYDDALTQIKIAGDLDPSSEIIRVNIMLAYIALGDHESALVEGDRLLSLNPKFWGARSWRGMVYLEQGRKQDAITDLEAGVSHSQNSHTLLANLGYACAYLDEPEKAIKILEDLKELHRHQKATGQGVAKVYAGLAKSGDAFDWLEKDYSVRSGDLPHISWHPAFKSLHGDPRYDDLLRRMGLQPKTDNDEQMSKRPAALRAAPPDRSPGLSPRWRSSGGAP